jgi:hypothetical protein
MKHARLIASATAVLALGVGIGAGALPASAEIDDIQACVEDWETPGTECPGAPEEPFDPTGDIDDFTTCTPPTHGDNPCVEDEPEDPGETPEDAPRPGTPTFTG